LPVKGQLPVSQGANHIDASQRDPSSLRSSE